MMLRSGQRRVSPPPFLPERPLLLQGNQAASTQLPSQPTRSSSPLRQVTVKEEPQEDLPVPSPGLAIERYIPCLSHLPRSSINPTTVMKQESGTTPSNHSEPIPRHPSQNFGEVVSAAAGSHGLNMQSAVKERMPYAWVDEYTAQQAYHLAITVSKKHLAQNDRKDFAKTLEAAKTTILELMTDEQRSGLNLDVPADYTGLKRTARQLDLIIPHVLIPTDPGILPMDRMIRAAQSYIGRLRDINGRMRKYAAQAENCAAPDTQGTLGSEPSDGVDNKSKNEVSAKAGKEKAKGKKGKKKAQSSRNKTSAPAIQIKPKASKKRRHESESDAEEEIATKSFKKERQKRSAPAVEPEMPELRVKEPKAKKKERKEKRHKIPCSTTEGDIPDKVLPVKKRKKDASPPSEDNTPEPATEHRKKKTKKSSGPDEEEPSEDPQPEPSSKKKKNKKAKKESTPVDETPAHNTPEPQSNADASFLSEALQTTEEKNHGLTQEISSLKAILQAVGISGVKLSVALTRMRHGQSAEEIFSSIKREGS